MVSYYLVTEEGEQVWLAGQNIRDCTPIPFRQGRELRKLPKLAPDADRERGGGTRKAANWRPFLKRYENQFGISPETPST